MSSSPLLRFARERLCADQHPADDHQFTVFRCAICGRRELRLRIEHHSGSSQRDFKGVVFAHCGVCDREERFFSFTGDHRKPVRNERPVCRCGHGEFLVAMLERIEGEQGLVGFFDEGVIVGECARCGRHKVFVYTD